MMVFGRWAARSSNAKGMVFVDWKGRAPRARGLCGASSMWCVRNFNCAH